MTRGVGSTSEMHHVPKESAAAAITIVERVMNTAELPHRNVPRRAVRMAGAAPTFRMQCVPKGTNAVLQRVSVETLLQLTAMPMRFVLRQGLQRYARTSTAVPTGEMHHVSLRNAAAMLAGAEFLQSTAPHIHRIYVRQIPEQTADVALISRMRSAKVPMSAVPRLDGAAPPSLTAARKRCADPPAMYLRGPIAGVAQDSITPLARETLSAAAYTASVARPLNTALHCRQRHLYSTQLFARSQVVLTFDAARTSAMPSALTSMPVAVQLDGAEPQTFIAMIIPSVQ